MAERLISQRELAETLKLTTQQIANLVRTGLPTRDRAGRRTYPLSECVRWFVSYREGVVTRKTKTTDLEDAQARKVEAEAKLKEIELAKAENEVASIEDVDREVALLLDRLRARILSTPGKHAPRFVGMRTINEAMTKLDNLASELLAELAGTADDIADNEVSDPDASEPT